jgi:hypothetical protein
LLHAITIRYNPFVIPEKHNAYCVWVANKATPQEANKKKNKKKRHKKQTKAKNKPKLELPIQGARSHSKPERLQWYDNSGARDWQS